jgi:hypothetical protein
MRPRQVRYQAALLPDITRLFILDYFPTRHPLRTPLSASCFICNFICEYFPADLLVALPKPRLVRVTRKYQSPGPAM